MDTHLLNCTMSRFAVGAAQTAEYSALRQSAISDQIADRCVMQFGNRGEDDGRSLNCTGIGRREHGACHRWEQARQRAQQGGLPAAIAPHKTDKITSAQLCRESAGYRAATMANHQIV